MPAFSRPHKLRNKPRSVGLLPGPTAERRDSLNARDLEDVGLRIVPIATVGWTHTFSALSMRLKGHSRTCTYTHTHTQTPTHFILMAACSHVCGLDLTDIGFKNPHNTSPCSTASCAPRLEPTWDDPAHLPGTTRPTYLGRPDSPTWDDPAHLPGPIHPSNPHQCYTCLTYLG